VHFCDVATPRLVGVSQKSTTGVGLVEVVIAVSIIAVVLGLATGIAALSLHIATKAKIDIQLTMLAEEGIEGVRAIRDYNNANNINSADGGLPSIYSGTKCLALNGAVLSLAAIGDGTCIVLPTGFSRTVAVTNAQATNKDATDGSSVLGGADPDDRTRKVTVTATAPDGSTKTLVTVLAKIK